MNSTLSELPDDALLDLLRIAVDPGPPLLEEASRRVDRLRPALEAWIRDETLWDAEGPESIAPVHATLVLAARADPRDLPLVLHALRFAHERGDVHLIDAADAVLAAFGPAAVPEYVREYASADLEFKLALNDTLTWLGFKFPEVRPAARDHLRTVVLEEEDETAQGIAVDLFLALAGNDENETLAILLDRGQVDEEAVEEARAGRAPLPVDPPRRPLDVFLPDAAAPADELPEELDEPDPVHVALDLVDRPTGDLPPLPLLNTAAKVGRNDPCPCNSGKKHKKCCGA